MGVDNPGSCAILINRSCAIRPGSCAILGVAQSVESSCAIRPHRIAQSWELRNPNNRSCAIRPKSCAIPGVAQSVESSCASRVAQSYELRNQSCAILRVAQSELRNPRSCAILVAQSTKELCNPSCAIRRSFGIGLYSYPRRTRSSLKLVNINSMDWRIDSTGNHP